MSRNAVRPIRLVVATACAVGLLLAGCSAGGPPVSGAPVSGPTSPEFPPSVTSDPGTSDTPTDDTDSDIDTGTAETPTDDTTTDDTTTDDTSTSTDDTSTEGSPRTAPAAADLFQPIDSTAGLQLTDPVRIDPAAATLALPGFSMQLTRVAQVAELPGDLADDNPESADALVPAAGHHFLLFSVRGTFDTLEADAAYDEVVQSVEYDRLREVEPPEISLVNGSPRAFTDLQETESSYLISVADGSAPKLSATFDDRTFSLDIATAALDKDTAAIRIMNDAKRYQKVDVTGSTTNWTVPGPTPDPATYTPTLTSLTRTAWDPVSGWARNGTVWVQVLVSTAGAQQIFGNTEQYTQDNASWTMTVDGKKYSPTGSAPYVSEVYNTDRGLAWFQIPATATSVTLSLSTTLTYVPHDEDDNKLTPVKRIADTRAITVPLR